VGRDDVREDEGKDGIYLSYISQLQEQSSLNKIHTERDVRVMPDPVTDDYVILASDEVLTTTV
jgi:hypothetical protein